MHETAFIVPVGHPAFAGHFPGRPVLPGVVLLGWAMEAVAAAGGPAAPLRVTAAKFLHPVGPGAVLRIRCEPEARGGWRFQILAGDTLACTGNLHPGQP